MSLKSPLSPNEELLPTTPTTTKNQPPLTKTQEAELKSYLVSFTHFDSNFTKLKTDVDYLESSIERLKAKLRQPLAIAKQKVKLLSRQQQASQQLVNLIKFCELAAKLGDSEKSQFNAKFIKEIDELILLEDLEDYEIVKKSSNMINLKKEKAFDDADRFLINGMQNQDQVEIVNALNITYYLNTLLPTIKSLYEQMEQQINNSIVNLFGFKAHPPGMPQFWDNFESSFNFIADELIKISILQTVLQKQKVPETNELYLDLIEKNLSYENLVSSLWSSFNNQLRSIVENLNKKNPNLHKLILDNYPKLISLIYQFLQKLAIKTSYYNDPQVQSVEKLTIMNSFSIYEQDYLKASYQRILKPVNLAFPSNTREIATRNDIGYLIRLMAKELDLVQLDTNLIEGVTQNIEKSIRIIHSRCSSMIIRDSSAYFIPNFSSLLTSSNSSQQLLKQSQSLTDSQQRNLDLALCLGHLYLQIKKSLVFKSSENLINLVNPVIETSLQKLSELIDNIIQPLSNKVQEDLEKMFLNLHQSNYR
ncbi:hypothetical protein CONCODRAFT_4305 [Conidiobolus coronatus NRRL 28638]|uniref:Conserved oligomeric Golgi complex subunit 5 helical domain-containing protein n=1 Tax=Conidiobolus coronatus (strain ATCC 28846 / CBS 209.66 / NRRL 28638) TaxID=796925 RepID=A0A137PCS8_CONC2|nr:hypothetical protein CONCODRAFT_4305 [Conidiobolus coronatus NRRL 28638]|eukprot:KXN72809.1 hypothetical protein CONCODRAFT_4305 [Conidiobolus coronatus NRRL 28638]